MVPGTGTSCLTLGDVLNLSMDFTSQRLNDNAKQFDNDVVVFASGLYKTEGD